MICLILASSKLNVFWHRTRTVDHIEKLYEGIDLQPVQRRATITAANEAFSVRMRM